MNTATPPLPTMNLAVSSAPLAHAVEFYADLELGEKKYQRIYKFSTVAPLTTAKQLQKTVEAEARRWAREVELMPAENKKYLIK